MKSTVDPLSGERLLTRNALLQGLTEDAAELTIELSSSHPMVEADGIGHGEDVTG